MKLFVVALCALAACTSAEEKPREKRGFLGGLGHGIVSHGGVGHGVLGHGIVSHGGVGHGVLGHGIVGHGGLGHAGGIIGGYSGHAVGYAPQVVTHNKVINVPKVVDVPQVVNVRKVVSVPQVVSVNRVVAAPAYSAGYLGGLAGHAGYSKGWW